MPDNTLPISRGSASSNVEVPCIVGYTDVIYEDFVYPPSPPENSARGMKSNGSSPLTLFSTTSSKRSREQEINCSDAVGVYDSDSAYHERSKCRISVPASYEEKIIKLTQERDRLLLRLEERQNHGDDTEKDGLNKSTLRNDIGSQDSSFDLNSLKAYYEGRLDAMATDLQQARQELSDALRASVQVLLDHSSEMASRSQAQRVEVEKLQDIIRDNEAKIESLERKLVEATNELQRSQGRCDILKEAVNQAREDSIQEERMVEALKEELKRTNMILDSGYKGKQKEGTKPISMRGQTASPNLIGIRPRISTFDLDSPRPQPRFSLPAVERAYGNSAAVTPKHGMMTSEDIRKAILEGLHMVQSNITNHVQHIVQGSSTSRRRSSTTRYVDRARMVRDVREFQQKLLGILRDEDITEAVREHAHFVTKEESESLARNADNISIDPLRPFWDNISCEYNCLLADRFTDIFTSSNTMYEDYREEVSAHFTQRLNNLRRMLLKSHVLQVDTNI